MLRIILRSFEVVLVTVVVVVAVAESSNTIAMVVRSYAIEEDALLVG